MKPISLLGMSMAAAASLAVSAGAEPVSSEEALAIHRGTLKPVTGTTCAPGEGEEIVVCGERSEVDPHRLPLPVKPEPGRRIAGEAGSAVDVAGKREKCSTSGPNQNCGGGLPVLQIAVAAVKALIKVAEHIADEE